MIINRHGIYYIPRITKQRNLCRLLFRPQTNCPLAHTKENYNYPTNFKPLRSYQEFRISPRRNSLEFACLFPSSQRALTHRFTSTQRVQRSTPSSIHKSTDTHSDTDETTRKSSLSVEIPVRYFLLVSWTRGGGRRRGNASRLPLVCGLLEVRVLVDDGNVSNRGSARLPTLGRRHGRRGLRQKFRPGEGDHDCTGGGREQDG